ncbi:unnamed protein product [Linum trigynum]|uniref:Uncharacterized protein n=1 Tax=Linum trigynum TaxID=586398 RepID=A0AAV2CN27_9ROSI
MQPLHQPPSSAPLPRCQPKNRRYRLSFLASHGQDLETVLPLSQVLCRPASDRIQSHSCPRTATSCFVSSSLASDGER